MSGREWLLSVAFAAFAALKLAEGWWALEEWPLSNVPMYAALRRADELPRRATILGLRHGTWFEMRPFQFALNRDELARRVLYADDVGAACGRLVREFNARRPPRRRVTEAHVRLETIARPQAPERGSDERVPCPLEVSP